MRISADESNPAGRRPLQLPGKPEPAEPASAHSVFKVVEHAAKNSQASVMVFDASGVCGWVNPGTKQLFGVEDASSLVGRLNLWQHCSVPADPQGEALERAFRGESVDLPILDYHLHQLAPGAFNPGELRVSAKLLPLLDDEGGVMALYVFNRQSVSNNVLHPPAETDLERLQLLRSISGAKSFARKTAHDFNNYIAVMQGFAAILQGRLREDEPNRALAEQIEASGGEALKLTAWLSAFASDAPMERSEVDLNQVINGVLTESQADKPEEIKVEVELAESLPPLAGSKEKLEQLCRSLWQNAIEAMPQGGRLRWHTSLDWLPDDGSDDGQTEPYLRLQVSDSGVGMDPNISTRMFDPFFTTKQGRQRGLGLTVAYEIVCAHSGFVEVTTGPGEGTSVNVCFPAKFDPQPSQSEGPGSDEAQKSGQLLVVDDEELIRQMLQEFLEGEGFGVTSVTSGEEALAICQDPEVDVDVVILDMSLPGISGQETFTRLMGLPRQIKVIISTGDPHQQAVHDVMGQGAHGMLSKPFRLDHLSEVVKQVLS